MKRVFSIWVCMNMDENSMNYVHLTDDKLLGTYQWQGGLDLLNIKDVSAMCNLLQGIREKGGQHRQRERTRQMIAKNKAKKDEAK